MYLFRYSIFLGYVITETVALLIFSVQCSVLLKKPFGDEVTTFLIAATQICISAWWNYKPYINMNMQLAYVMFHEALR